MPRIKTDVIEPDEDPTAVIEDEAKAKVELKTNADIKNDEKDFRIVLPQSIRCDHDGKYVSIGVNNRNQIVAVYHHGNLSNCMYYSVGKIYMDKEEIKWGPEYKYDHGGYPKVSLNDSGILVEVHESPHKRNVWCRVGAINDDNTIDWGQLHENGGGTHPSVALNNDDTVVIIHESGSRLSYEVFYWFGRVNRIRKTVDWIRKKELLLSSAQELSVAICKQDILVTFRSGIRQHPLYTLLGKIKDEIIVWAERDPVSFGSGNWPSISFNSEGTVVVTFQSFVMRALQCREGVLKEKDGVHAITWSKRPSRTYILGAYPAVAVLDGNHMIEMHGTNKLNGTTMFYFVGILKQ